MKSIIMLIVVTFGINISNSQSVVGGVEKYHVGGYYKFSHSDTINTYNALNNNLDSNMGGFKTNFDLIFDYYNRKITLHDLNNGKQFNYDIIKVDTLGPNTISYFLYCDGFICSYCVFDNTPTEKMILYGYKLNDRIYGWQAVVK